MKEISPCSAGRRCITVHLGLPKWKSRFLSSAPIDYVRGWGPFDPGTNPAPGGGTAPNVGRRWPP